MKSNKRISKLENKVNLMSNEISQIKRNIIEKDSGLKEINNK